MAQTMRFDVRTHRRPDARSEVGSSVRCRGSIWLLQSRLICGVVLGTITIPGVLAHGLSVSGLPATAAFLAAVALPWEWRARKMGLRVTDEGIVATRAVDTVHLNWPEIAAFFARDVGVWGDKTIHVQRKRFLGRGVPKGIGLTLPTLMIVSPNNPIGRWAGPCDLLHGERRIPQEQVVAFLTDQLFRHTEQHTG
jgi:hypothetical protein